MENKPVKRLDRRSKVPFYLQLANTFRREILDGVYPFKEALPTLDELSGQLGLSVEYLQKTFDVLMHEKLVDYDAPVYRCKFKSVPTVIFEKVSDFRFIIESRGMAYHIVDQPIVLEKRQDGDWILLHRNYFGDQQCLIHAIARFKADAFPRLIHKPIDDTRNFASIFQENGITRFDTLKTIDHIPLPDELANEMNQPKNTTCSRTRYEVKQNDQLILVSDSYIIGFGFRFNFLTKLAKK
ncbi:MAG: hypothetical protein A2Y20_04125 [Firmicutes bacterium GWF2_51_9]|nr:MAG: hypothetical protein A2Y20_04125 [Firmicutes bacterium GWF2_51_9]OGS59616.1 MAG: hypothetical protein A2Y19_01705 [Firmicutes bacterium GWE2_51_13]